MITLVDIFMSKKNIEKGIRNVPIRIAGRPDHLRYLLSRACYARSKPDTYILHPSAEGQRCNARCENETCLTEIDRTFLFKLWIPKYAAELNDGDGEKSPKPHKIFD